MYEGQAIPADQQNIAYSSYIPVRVLGKKRDQTICYSLYGKSDGYSIRSSVDTDLMSVQSMVYSDSLSFSKHSAGETEQAITLREIGLCTNFKSLSSVSGRAASADVS